MVFINSCRRSYYGERCAIRTPDIREFLDGMVSDVFLPCIQALCRLPAWHVMCILKKSFENNPLDSKSRNYFES